MERDSFLDLLCRVQVRTLGRGQGGGGGLIAGEETWEEGGGGGD